MSSTKVQDLLRPMDFQKVTPQTLLESKQAATAITALTAYDYPTARLVDEAGIDLLLVGDSLGMAVLGYDNTLSVTMDDMLHHARAVRRGTRRAMLVVDMPYGSYQVSVEETLRNALRLVKEAGSEAVKLEGGASQASRVMALTKQRSPWWATSASRRNRCTAWVAIVCREDPQWPRSSCKMMRWRFKRPEPLRWCLRESPANLQRKLLLPS